MGGGTTSYKEVEETDVVLLWGGNARETHPIFFHHVLSGIHTGARLYAIDPRRTTRAGGAVGVGGQSAPGPEQRPGRRRHGRPPGPAAWLPACRKRRAAGPVRARLGSADSAPARLAPHGDVRGHGARGALRPLR